ncbi:MAG TPA: hypothetical protein VLA66_06505, partial [Thermoanaerobaculia bacterium]|nr:hypothetical protein [Thermoanaerobaculia bacterium]
MNGAPWTPIEGRCAGRRLRGGRVSRLLLLAALLAGTPLAAATQRATVGSGDRAALVDNREIYLEARPLAGEGLLAFCRRLTGSTESCREIAKLNRNPRRLLAGVRYRVPYGLLATDLQLAAVRALFPHDRALPEGWMHRTRGEDLGRVAEWFSGSAGNVGALRSANGLASDRLDPGAEVLVPREVLR